MTPPYQAQQRRRQRPPNPLQTATTVATVAVAAYGTYRLASWAWNSFWNDEENDAQKRRPAHHALRTLGISGGRHRNTAPP